MEDLKQETTIKLINDMTYLDHEIDLLLLKHEKIRLELIRRFPNIEKDDSFKPKQKKI